MKDLTKNWIPRVSFFILGQVIIAFGISLAYKSRSNGSGAYDALNHALAYDFKPTQALNIPIGTWISLVGLVCLFLSALIAWRMPQFLSVITIFVMGGLIQGWTFILDSETEFIGVVPSVLSTATSILLVSIGIALYLLPKYPVAPVELVTLALTERFNWSFGVAKLVQEVVTMGLAFLLGGPIWMGTIAFTFLLGPMAQFWLKPFSVFYGKFVKD